MVINRKEFKAIVERVRKMAYLDDSIKQAIEEVNNFDWEKRRREGYGSLIEDETYEMLNDKISEKIADIISELDISWEEIIEIYSDTRIDFDKIDSLEKRNVMKGAFFSIVQVNSIESIVNELILKAQ